MDRNEDVEDPVTAGTIPAPTRPSSISTVYTYDGWDDDLTAIIAPRTLTAKYSETPRQYTVKWYSTIGIVMDKAGQDEMLERLTMYFIKMYQAQDISLIADKEERRRKRDELENDEATGATLGSQISQNMALVIPNDLDHAIKDKHSMKHYQRYMDDGNVTGTKEELHSLRKVIAEMCDRLGLKLNQKKTHIIRARRGFTFLKVRYVVTETGRIIKTIAKSGIVRMRRKLKKFRKKVEQGQMSRRDVYNSFMSWYGTAKKVASTYRQRKRMLNLYNSLFHQYRTGGMIA